MLYTVLVASNSVMDPKTVFLGSLTTQVEVLSIGISISFGVYAEYYVVHLVELNL